MNYKLADLSIDELIQLAQGICRCLELSENIIKLDVSENELENGLSDVLKNLHFNQFDFAMRDLGKNGVIGWAFYEPDGCSKADFFFEFDAKTFKFFREKIFGTLVEDRIRLLSKIESLEQKIEKMYGFNPDKINSDIQEANNKAEELLGIIKKNEMLSSLEKPVLEYTQYLQNINNINKVYDDVYLNIIKPVKEEGKNGVKATAIWAVISIVVATVASIVISNWSSIMNIYKSIPTNH